MVGYESVLEINPLTLTNSSSLDVEYKDTVGGMVLLVTTGFRIGVIDAHDVSVTLGMCLEYLMREHVPKSRSFFIQKHLRPLVYSQK